MSTETKRKKARTSLTPEIIANLKSLCDGQKGVKELTAATGLSRCTIYKLRAIHGLNIPIDEGKQRRGKGASYFHTTPVIF